MITIIGTVTAKPETREELLTLLEAQIEPTRAEPGCINYDFHVDEIDPCAFVFYENWKDEEVFQAHLQMPHLKPLFGQIERLLAKPVDIRRIRMLSRFA